MSELVQARTQRMPAELWTALDEESRRTGVSTAELVRHGAELELAFLAALRAANKGEDLAGLLARIVQRLD